MILCNLSPFIFLPIAMFCISISCVAHFHRFNCKTSIVCLPWIFLGCEPNVVAIFQLIKYTIGSDHWHIFAILFFHYTLFYFPRLLFQYFTYPLKYFCGLWEWIHLFKIYCEFIIDSTLASLARFWRKNWFLSSSKIGCFTV